MLTALGQSLPIAVGLALAALPVVVVAVVLVAKRPLPVAAAFLGGWLVGLVLVGAAVVLLADLVSLGSGPGWVGGVVKLVLGLVLLGVGVAKWRGRHVAASEASGPLASVETMPAARAFLVGALLAAANPKNLVFVVAGATTIAEATPRVGEQVVALGVFAVVASLGVAAPVVLRAVLGPRADRPLALADRWMTRHQAAILSVVALVLGVALVANGLRSL